MDKPSEDLREHEAPSLSGLEQEKSREAYETAELLVELLHAHKRQFHSAAKEHGLSPQQVAALWYLVPGESLPMNALADLLMCDASNVTGIVDKLEARGLARRGQGADRRVKVLTLTDAGLSTRTCIRDRVLSPPSWLCAMDREDQRTLRDLLRRAVRALRGE